MEDHRDRFSRARRDVSVVIPTHNRSSVLRTSLERLASTTLTRPWELIVVANACTDDTARVIAELAWDEVAPVRLVEELRPSAAFARNRGALAAAGSLLVFLDDDILLEPEGLATILEWYDASDRSSVLVGQLFPLAEHLATPFGSFRQATLGDVPKELQPVDWFASGLAAIPAELFRDLGGYADHYPAAGLEDADFAIRARRAGHHIIFHPSVIGLHNDWAGSTARDYCRRAAAQCATAPLLASAFPDNDHPWGRIIEVNQPPNSGDPLSVRLRKQLKVGAVRLGADRWLPALADRAPPRRRPQELMFRASVSLAMFAGYQRGLQQLANDGPLTIGAERSMRRQRGPRLALLEAMDVPARLLAKAGLHGLNGLGRQIAERLTGDRLSVSVRGIHLSGQLIHRGYLYGIRRNECEPYMASLFERLLEPGMTVVDVGAFIGYYTVKAGLIVGPTGTVISLEPDAANFSELQANVEANATGKWTMLERSAASDQDGEVAFYADRWDPSQSGVGGFRRGTASIMVPCRKLDRVLEGVEHIDLLKIDTEGFELAVLRGLESTINRLAGRPVSIFIECFPDGLRALGATPEALLDWLRVHGFSVGSIDEKAECVVQVRAGEITYGNWFCTTSDAIWRSVAKAQ